jgi:Asp-tRNA(Asn)/Glu-tRNA(Gln) amidotransferase A subunit family amidase
VPPRDAAVVSRIKQAGAVVFGKTNLPAWSRRILTHPGRFCGISSHKASYGIVPQSGYLDRLDGDTSYADLNVIGPLAMHPRDLGGAGDEQRGDHAVHRGHPPRSVTSLHTVSYPPRCSLIG